MKDGDSEILMGCVFVVVGSIIFVIVGYHFFGPATYWTVGGLLGLILFFAGWSLIDHAN